MTTPKRDRGAVAFVRVPLSEEEMRRLAGVLPARAAEQAVLLLWQIFRDGQSAQHANGDLARTRQTLRALRRALDARRWDRATTLLQETSALTWRVIVDRAVVFGMDGLLLPDAARADKEAALRAMADAGSTDLLAALRLGTPTPADVRGKVALLALRTVVRALDGDPALRARGRPVGVRNRWFVARLQNTLRRYAVYTVARMDRVYGAIQAAEPALPADWRKVGRFRDFSVAPSASRISP